MEGFCILKKDKTFDLGCSNKELGTEARTTEEVKVKVRIRYRSEACNVMGAQKWTCD